MRLNVPGESDYIGAGVHFCATCDGPFYRGKRVAVVGGGNSASDESMLLTKFADSVTMLVRGESLRATKVVQENLMADSKMRVLWNTEVQEFIGANSKLHALRLRNNVTGDEHIAEFDGAFIFIGLTPNTSLLGASGVKLDEWGFVVTGHGLLRHGERPDGFPDRDPEVLETSVPGIFAAGDVRAGSTKQVASASGEGATAGLLVRDYLRSV